MNGGGGRKARKENIGPYTKRRGPRAEKEQKKTIVKSEFVGTRDRSDVPPLEDVVMTHAQLEEEKEQARIAKIERYEKEQERIARINAKRAWAIEQTRLRKSEMVSDTRRIPFEKPASQMDYYGLSSTRESRYRPSKFPVASMTPECRDSIMKRNPLCTKEQLRGWAGSVGLSIQGTRGELIERIRYYLNFTKGRAADRP